MKYLFVLFACICFLNSFSQKLPNIILKNIEGEFVNVSEISNNEKPILLIFWKSCCNSNIEMLEIINEEYEFWQEETEVKIIIVAVDDTRSSYKIPLIVNSKNWTFDALLDVNSDLKRILSISILPHFIILNSENSIVWQKSGFLNGDETEIINFLKNINK